MRMGEFMMPGYGFGMMLFWLLLIVVAVLLVVRISKGNGSNMSNHQLEKIAQVQKESLRRQEELAEELEEVKKQLYKLEGMLKK